MKKARLHKCTKPDIQENFNTDTVDITSNLNSMNQFENQPVKCVVRMKKFHFISFTFLFLFTITCFSQNEPYIKGDIETSINNELDHFFNCLNFDSLLNTDQSLRKSVLNQTYLQQLIEKKGYGNLEITSSVIPDEIATINKKTLLFNELMDSVAEWFPICQDPNFNSDADYLLNLGGDGKITYLWKDKQQNSPYTSYYFQNKLYITVSAGLLFNCDYFNKNDRRCYIPIEPAQGNSRKIALTDIEWEKNSLGQEVFYQNKLKMNIVLTNISSNYKPYISTDIKSDTIIKVIKKGIIYKKDIKSDFIAVTDSFVSVNPNPITIRSYNFQNRQFYFTFVVDLPKLSNWKADKIKPKLIIISTNTPPKIKDILHGENKFHLGLSIGNNNIFWKGTQLPSGSSGNIKNEGSSAGMDLSLSYRINEKLQGVCFQAKAVMGVHEYSSLLDNFSYENNLDYKGHNGFGDFTWNYLTSIDQLKTTISTIEPCLLLGVVYKPSLRGQSLNLDLDLSVGYQYSAIMKEKYESTGLNAFITTKGQYADFPVILSNAPEYNFQTFNGQQVTNNMVSSISKSYSSLVLSFQPSLRIREKVSIFLDISYAYGLTSIEKGTFSYVDQTSDGKSILFGNPLYNSMGNNLTISTLRISGGVSIPLFN